LVRAYARGASEDTKADAKKAAEGGDLPIAALGSGSDFSPFLQHLGLASLSISYGGEDEESGSYHSNYDSFDHYIRFGDPTLAYGVAQAQTVGHLILRVANAEVLPMQFGALAETVGGYVQELHKLADDKRKAAEDLVKLLDQKAFTLASDPTKPVLPPAREPEVPFLDFAPLDNAIARLKKSAKAYDDAYASAAPMSVAQRKELNSLLRGLEQTLTAAQGLPRRDWYKHLIYAPGLLTGYGVKTIPGVREAIDENQWSEANQYTVLTAKALDSYGERLDQATKLITRGP
jgi:N-acetylated-alpha-linked acidic dipeptidase